MDKQPITSFQRPPHDNGRGVHLLDTSGWKGGEQGLDYWIAELQSLGIKWVQLLDDNGDSLPVCTALVAAGIFPVVRILRRDRPPNDSREPNPGHLNAAEEQTIRRLIDSGVLYFETNNEPDLTEQWKNGAIPADPEEAAKLIALNWLFDARFIREAGGYPGLPALSVGSSMDLMGALVSLGRQKILLEGCWIAVHNYGLNRPLDYPNDPASTSGEPLTYVQYDHGPLTTWAWWNPDKVRADSLDDVNYLRRSAKNIGANIVQEHACFREFEYYDMLARKYLGRSVPILGTEGGYQIGRRQDPRYPRITPQMQAELTVAMFDGMQNTAPDYYFASIACFLLPSNGRQQDAWYDDFWQRAFQNGPRTNVGVPPFPVLGTKLGPNLPVVTAVKAMPNVPRAGLPPPVARPVAVADRKPAAAPPPRTAINYVVERGDTLSTIARKFATTVTAIARANKIVDPSQLTVGQNLLVPPADTFPPPPPPAFKRGGPAASAPHSRRPPPPQPGGTSHFDPRLLALGVHLEPATVASGFVYWKLVRATYQDPSKPDGGHSLSFGLLDENGAPVAGQRVIKAWADGQAEATTTDSGTADLQLSSSSFPVNGETGPYSAWVDGLPSDRVSGLGLPLERPIDYRLTWQKTTK